MYLKKIRRVIFIIESESLLNYLNNPNICLFCNKPILPKEHEVLYHVKIKKFCNRSCSAKYNNTRRIIKRTVIEHNCRLCGNIIKYRAGISKSNYKKRKYCDNCLNDHTYARKIVNITKKQLFDKCKNWQSARSYICKHARVVFKKSDKLKICQICGDVKIIEINDVDNLIALCPNHHWELDNGILQLDK